MARFDCQKGEFIFFIFFQEKNNKIGEFATRQLLWHWLPFQSLGVGQTLSRSASQIWGYFWVPNSSHFDANIRVPVNLKPSGTGCVLDAKLEITRRIPLECPGRCRVIQHLAIHLPVNLDINIKQFISPSNHWQIVRKSIIQFTGIQQLVNPPGTPLGVMCFSSTAGGFWKSTSVGGASDLFVRRVSCCPAPRLEMCDAGRCTIELTWRRCLEPRAAMNLGCPRLVYFLLVLLLVIW